MNLDAAASTGHLAILHNPRYPRRPIVAHAGQLQFVSRLKAAFPGFFASARTLEIGSLDINGSVRQLFDGGAYIGLDIAAGPGVDVVCEGQNYRAPDGSFDTVISCEAMEHNPYWKETSVNMVRLCRPGGLVVLTCATTVRTEHGTTRTNPADSPLTVGLGWNYYRNLTARDFTRALPLHVDLAPMAFISNWAARDLYLIGFKRGAEPPAGAARKIADLRRHYLWANIRHAVTSHYLPLRTAIAILGEERYTSWRFGSR
jgi:SAM-dependent methyltransferase